MKYLSEYPDVFKEALNGMKDCCYLSDAQGVLRFANTSFCDFFEVQSDDILGQQMDQIELPSRDFKLLYDEDQKAMASGLSVENFYDFRGNPSCKLNQAKTSKTFLTDSQGKGIGVSGVITILGEEFMQSNLLARGVKHYQNIQKLTISISALTSEQGILWELAEESAKLLGLDDCVIYMLDDLDQTLIQKAAFGAKRKGAVVLSPISLKIGQGIVGTAAQSLETLLVDDLEQDGRYFKDSFDAKSELSVPIVFQGKVLGVIDSESKELSHFNIKHRDFLEAIASIAALKITELRNLKEVKEKEQYLNQVLESPKELMSYSIDRQFRYKSFNKNHAQMINEQYGVKIQIGMNVLDISKGKKKNQELTHALNNALNGDEFVIIEDFNDENRGIRQILEKNYSPLFAINGNIIGVTVFMKDVTATSMAMKRLEEREHLLQSINTNIRDGIFRYSLKKGYLYSNKMFLDMFGVEGKGRKDADVSGGFVSKREFLKLYNSVLRDGYAENWEVQLKKQDGSTFWGLVDCRMTIQDGDKVIDGALIDITSMKEMTQNLIKTNSEMDQLVYRTSHDLRAPIASLLGLENLLEGMLSAPEQKELLGIMKGQLNILDGIIMDIITYRKIAKLGLTKDVINFESVISKVFESIQFMENSDHVKRDVQINASASFVHDSHNIQVLFNNLISNAIKYAKKDDATSFVKITGDIDEHHARIVIEDNGIGIDEKYLGSVFKMFYRATNHATGTGLGLFIVKEAIEKLGGSIEVTSEVGKGSVFAFDIPNQVEN